MSKIYKNWTVHNIIAHPLSEIIYLLSFGQALRLSSYIHDSTVPEHTPGTGRG